MKHILLASLIATISGCSNTSALGETQAELELKGLKIGQTLKECPKKTLEKKTDRTLICTLPDRSLADVEVTSALTAALDNKIVLVKYQLTQNSGFSQPAVLRALTQKFGQPTPGGRSWVHIWRNNYSLMRGTGIQLQLDEIKGEVTMLSIEGLPALQAELARIGSKDL